LEQEIIFGNYTELEIIPLDKLVPFAQQLLQYQGASVAHLAWKKEVCSGSFWYYFST